MVSLLYRVRKKRRQNSSENFVNRTKLWVLCCFQHPPKGMSGCAVQGHLCALPVLCLSAMWAVLVSVVRSTEARTGAGAVLGWILAGAGSKQ